MKLLELFEQPLQEVVQNPSVWLRWSQSPAAAQIRLGFEAELIVPVREPMEDPEPEPDYSENPPAVDIEEVIDFYSSTDFGMSRREANELRERMQHDFNVYLEQKVDDAFEEQGDSLIRQLAQSQDIPDEQLEIGSDTYDQLSDQVRDQLRDQLYAETDERDWMRSEGIRRMTDIENHYNVTWPIWETPRHNQSMEQVREVAQHISRDVGIKVRSVTTYHAVPRGADAWILEPDSSIKVTDEQSEAGLELITPTPPPLLPESLVYLDRVFDWARSYGCETNRSTGFHMNMSLPPDVHGNLDPVKLILLLGDQKVLADFGRSANTYTASAFKLLQDHVSSKENFPVHEALEALRKGLTQLAGTHVQAPMGKYVSVHVKPTYVEFRHAGGDYLDQLPEIKNTLLRMAYTLSVSADVNLAKADYARKLYKLLSGFARPRHVDAVINLFSLYQAGVINKDVLKRSVQQMRMNLSASSMSA